jgi:hypothetical protein
LIHYIEETIGGKNTMPAPSARPYDGMFATDEMLYSLLRQAAGTVALFCDNEGTPRWEITERLHKKPRRRKNERKTDLADVAICYDSE